MAHYLFRPSEMATSWLFTGLPRSGKTYHAVEIIKDWLKRGGYVLTNVLINVKFLPKKQRDRVKYLPTVKDVVEGLLDFRALIGGGHILLVLDEVAAVFDSRNWSKFPADLRAVLTQHAKMRVTIITICHRHDLVDTSFRKLAGYVVEHRALQRAGGCLGLICGIFVPGAMLRYTMEMDSKGDPTGDPYEKKLYFVREKVHRLYDTFQIVEGSFAGSSTLKQGVVISAGIKRKLLLFAVIFCLFRFTGLNSMPTPPGPKRPDFSKPFATLHGQVVCLDERYGVVDICTSSGEYFKVAPDREKWGKDPLSWIGSYVSVDVPSTAPILANEEMRKRIHDAAQFQKK